MEFTDLVLLCFLIFTSASPAIANSIHGCGGFVEATSSLIKAGKASDAKFDASDAKFDYSHITVELQTVDGLVKDRTQCAPNGYYFIPVYDKGSFVVTVKGPDGWSWNPARVPVIVDQNGCNADADINFQLTGFVLSGKVRGAVGGKSCSSKHVGPSNVKVELLSPDSALISSVLTSESGHYSFKNVMPGMYHLRASHPNMDVKLEGTPQVELGFGNAIVDDIFFVAGYDIRGSVVAQGNPILGVHIYLYSDDVLTVNCPHDQTSAPGRNVALCHAISDENGVFTFSSIPCGEYELVPYYKGENTVFDILPPSIMVSVEHHDVLVDQKFQVTGFSVGGRVIDGFGSGISGVKILLDGTQKAITDSQGYYKLDQVTSKKYSIVAIKDHYKFRDLDDFLVLPSMAAVADIEALTYDLCGVVHLIDKSQKVKVALTHGPVNPQLKSISEGGRFCFQVPVGEYRLSALAANPQDSASLLFSPPYIDLLVKGPVVNVEFHQALVNVHGTVQCKDKCSSAITVSLISQVRGSGDRRSMAIRGETGDFSFHDLLPGKYQLEIKHNASLFEDDWCWEQNIIDLDLGPENMEGISFIQKGYWMTIVSTHDVDASIQHPDSSSTNLQIKSGSQRLCVESPGLHELHFVDSCILFGSSSLTFDTLNPMSIHLTGEKYLVSGEIHIQSSILDDPVGLANYLVVDIFNEEDAVVDSVKTTFIQNGSDQVAVYKYQIWSVLGKQLKFVPRDTRATQKRILFYPRKRHVSVLNDGCQAAVTPISGRPGKYIEGSVSPATSNVDIHILAQGSSENALLKKGDLAMETRTAADGSFIAGPLYDDTDYSVEALKPGYHLKAIGANTFSCQKLGQISIRIFPMEPENELFPPVLLSLSGDDGYRNNTVASAGGSFIFTDLFPGNFYLRPLLKEYSFSPSAEAIKLGSGEHKEVIFHATRVAYSVLGTVSLLSGLPKEGVYLEARSDTKGYYEEARSDSFGRYRLRGLLPHTSYSVKVVNKYNNGPLGIERTSPEHVVLDIGTEDITGMDFVVFERPEVTILSGHVEGNNLEELQPHLLVEVRSASDPVKVVSAFPLPLSYFFEIRDLPKGKFLLQLASQLSPATYKFDAAILEVDIDEGSHIHVGPLGYQMEEYRQKQEISPAPVFPLVAVAAVIAFFIGISRMKDLYQAVLGAKTFASNAVAGRKDGRKLVTKRRL